MKKLISGYHADMDQKLDNGEPLQVEEQKGVSPQGRQVNGEKQRDEVGDSQLEATLRRSPKTDIENWVNWARERVENAFPDEEWDHFEGGSSAEVFRSKRDGRVCKLMFGMAVDDQGRRVLDRKSRDYYRSEKGSNDPALKRGFGAKNDWLSRRGRIRFTGDGVCGF